MFNWNSDCSYSTTNKESKTENQKGKDSVALRYIIYMRKLSNCNVLTALKFT